MKLASGNLLRAEGEHRENEVFEDLLRRPGVRIERIVSRGHTTPPDKPYVQAWDEWVLVVAGSARLSFEELGERTLAAGDHLLIPAACRTWQPTQPIQRFGTRSILASINLDIDVFGVVTFAYNTDDRRPKTVP